MLGSSADLSPESFTLKVKLELLGPDLSRQGYRQRGATAGDKAYTGAEQAWEARKAIKATVGLMVTSV